MMAEVKHEAYIKEGLAFEKMAVPLLDPMKGIPTMHGKDANFTEEWSIEAIVAAIDSIEAFPTCALKARLAKMRIRLPFAHDVEQLMSPLAYKDHCGAVWRLCKALAKG